MERTEQWISRLDAVTNAFQDAFGQWDETRLNQQPAAGQWSVAEIIQHLIILNSSYLPLIEKLREGTLKLSWTARIPWITKRFGKMIYRSVLPETSRKTRTMPIWQPRRSEIPPGILKRFAAHQEKLKAVISGSRELIDQKAVICSPANKFIAYPLDMLFDILVAHEERHLGQALKLAGPA